MVVVEVVTDSRLCSLFINVSMFSVFLCLLSILHLSQWYIHLAFAMVIISSLFIPSSSRLHSALLKACFRPTLLATRSFISLIPLHS